MLKEIIDKFYLEKNNDRPQTTFYISEAGKCPRAIFLKFKNAPRKEFDPALLRLFDHGENMHRMIMKPLLSTRDIHVVASEVDIPPQEIVRGRADAVLSDGKELFVLDIKSSNSIIFRNMRVPKEENVYQIQLYLHFLKIKRGILLYVDKDRLELKEFMISYNKKLAESLLAGLLSLKQKIEKNIVPSRIDSYPSLSQCRYCQYKAVCKLTSGEEMTWEQLKERISTYYSCP